MRPNAQVHVLSSIALALLLGTWVGSAAAEPAPRPAPAARSAKAVVEVESLAPQAKVTAGAMSVQDMTPFGTGWGGGAQLFWQPPPPQDEPIRNWPALTVLLNHSGTGRYNLVLHYTVAPDYGKVRVFLDGSPKVDVNGWGDAVMLRSVQLGEVEFAGKPHQLVFTVFGKDAASIGYFVGLDRFELIPVAQPPSAAAGAASHVESAVTVAAGATGSSTLALSGVALLATPQPCGGKEKGLLCQSVCNGTQSVDLNACNGEGACKLFVTVPCSPYQCRDGTCLVSCSSDEQCAASYACRGGRCLLRPSY